MYSKQHILRRTFIHPEPVPERRAVFPVFIPFSGCPQRCVFCAQDVQTGKTVDTISRILENTGLALEQVRKKRAAQASGKTASALPLELAFYGGTFTALNPKDFEACLDFARYWQGQGLITNLRCSTRPDAVNPAILARLREAGFTLVELGIQSFSTQALAVAGRGYTQEQALAACAMVQGAGLSLGIQLMPGMPGVDADTARADLRMAGALRPDCARLYPCLVLEGSALAALWRDGRFTPWSEDAALALLADACLEFWQAGTRVIRMGLAPEDGLTAAILAGPQHPSLGSRARGLALCLLIEEYVRQLPLSPSARLHLTAPRRYQGEFWGFRKELAARYQALGLTQEDIAWHDSPEFILEVISPQGL